MTLQELAAQEAARVVKDVLFYGRTQRSTNVVVKAIIKVTEAHNKELVEQIAGLKIDIHDAVWNLAGIDCIAMGWVSPHDPIDPELVRPALQSVIALAKRAETFEAHNKELIEQNKQLVDALEDANAGLLYWQRGLSESNKKLGAQIKAIIGKADTALALAKK